MSSSIAPLRRSILIEETPDNEDFPAVLVDPELGQRLRLDGRGLEVARLLQAITTLDGLAEELDAEVTVVERAVSLFQRLHLLDTDESRTFVTEARAGSEWQQANPETVPLLIRDDAAFTCTMCGSCCGGHNVGPVAVDVVQGLSSVRDELTELTQTEKGLFFRVPVETPSGVEDQIVCHSRGGSCVFLNDERRCSIHQAYGPERKPRVCRLFPYQFIATPKGISVSLQMECRGFNEARTGKPLKAQEAELRSLLAIVPSLRRVRPVIMLDGLSPISYDTYEGIEQALHDAIDQHPDRPIDALLAMRSVIENERGCASDIAPEDSEIDTLKRDLDQLMGGLLETVQILNDQFQQDDDGSVVHTETLRELAAAARSLRSDWARVLQPLSRPDQRSLFREVMHHHLMGKELTVARTVVLGAARLNLGWMLAKALMIARARQVKRRHLVEQDVMDAVVVMNFLLRNHGFLKALQRHDSEIVSLFYERFRELVAAGSAMADPDRRVEFYKF